MVTTTLAEEVAARINQRQIERDNAERAKVEREVREVRDREDRLRQAKEARGEAGVAALFKKLKASVTVEHFDRRFHIDMSHADVVHRDVAVEAVSRLMRYIVQSVRACAITARNVGAAGGVVSTKPSNPLWVEKLLNLDLRDAHVRGLVTVTDLKGKAVKLKTDKVTLAPAPTRQTTGHRDAWLSGSEPIATERHMRAR